MNRIVPSLVMLMLWTLSAKGQPIYNPPIEPCPALNPSGPAFGWAAAALEVGCSTNRCHTEPRIDPLPIPSIEVCPGETVSACNLFTNIPGQLVQTCTNLDCSTTNIISEGGSSQIIAEWWVATGLVSTNGTGRCAAFLTPTNPGSGTITFYLTYTNDPPCTNRATITNSVSYTALAPITASNSAIFLDPDPRGQTNTCDTMVATISATLEFCPKPGSDILLTAEVVDLTANVVFVTIICMDDQDSREVSGNRVRMKKVVGQYQPGVATNGAVRIVGRSGSNCTGGETQEICPPPCPNNGRWICVGWKVWSTANGNPAAHVAPQQMLPACPVGSPRECTPPE